MQELQPTLKDNTRRIKGLLLFLTVVTTTIIVYNLSLSWKEVHVTAEFKNINHHTIIQNFPGHGSKTKDKKLDEQQKTTNSNHPQMGTTPTEIIKVNNYIYGIRENRENTFKKNDPEGGQDKRRKTLNHSTKDKNTESLMKNEKADKWRNRSHTYKKITESHSIKKNNWKTTSHRLNERKFSAVNRANQRKTLGKKTVNNKTKRQQNNLQRKTKISQKTNKKNESKFSTSRLCGTGWQERYARLHKNILDFNQEEKYLAYTCPGTQQGCCGYGNRLRAVVSIFYLAILTDRAFLIDWLVPEPIENHLLPNQIQWNYSTPLDVCKTELEVRNHYWGTASAEKKKAEGWIIQDSHHFRNWFTSTNLSVYFDQPVEKITTIWYFAEGGIDKNPYLMSRAKELGIKPLLTPGPKYSLIKCAFDVLFQRSPAVESHLKAWKDELRHTEGPKIGIHIRTGDKQFNFFAQEDDRSLNLKNISKLDKFFQCARQIENTVFSSSERGDIRWFLASDHEAVKTYAKTTYPQKVVTTNLTIQHLDILYNTTVFNDTIECNYTTGINGSAWCYKIEPFNRTAYCAKLANLTNTNYTDTNRTNANNTRSFTEGIIAMLVDHIILSECDFLILCDSSFSSTAVGLGIKGAGKFVMGDRNCEDYKTAQQHKMMRFFRRKRSVTVPNVDRVMDGLVTW